MKPTYSISPEQPLTLAQIATILSSQQSIDLAPAAREAIVRCRTFLDQKIKSGNDLYYGINTGFGALCHVAISPDQTEALQHNLVMSHACGMGPKVPQEIVRLMLLLKIQSLSFGHSGVALTTVERLVDMYNDDVLPVIYEQGSLGASGDLAPLAHLSLPLLGMGEVYYAGQIQPAETVLAAKSWAPLHLQAKEGLALLNGTQFMSAYGVHLLLQAHELMDHADAIGALSADAYACRIDPFLAPIHRIRNQPGQIKVAQHIRDLLADSEIIKQEKAQIQDPYSFRCMPQVHGASRDAIAYVQQVVEREIAGVTDNPNIFVEEEQILSGGNFHGQPLALALDHLAIALAELGSIAERRIYLLLTGSHGLPKFLTKGSGLHSGLMIPQYTAASIVSQNKQLCTPASVDSIVSSNGQEDHVSMGANAATKALRVLENLSRIQAIEWHTAAQAIAQRRPLRTGSQLENVLTDYRQKLPFREDDRPLYTELRDTEQFLAQLPRGTFVPAH